MAAFPGWAGRVPHVERFGALAALPLCHGERTLGGLGLAFDAERLFLPEEQAALLAVVEEGALALERIRLAGAALEAAAPAMPEHS